mgnify:CR=1 FL=1
MRHGYTTATLAKKMGVFDSTVSRLVNGNPTIAKLRELAEAIGCNVWEFFTDEIMSDGYTVTPQGGQQAGTGAAGQPTGAGAAGQTTGTGAAGQQEEPSVPLQQEQSAASLQQEQSAASLQQEQSAASLQQAIVCPHCSHPIVITVR